MKKFLLGLVLALSISCPLFGQATTGFHRVAIALSRAQSGLNAQIVPNATVTVTQTSTGTAATIYSDPLLSSIISPSVVTADNSGNYGYYIALNYCVTETITSPGQKTQVIPNVCNLGGGDGGYPGVTSDGSNGLLIQGNVNPGTLENSYNAGICGAGTTPSWCSGSDIFAWVNAAETACTGGSACNITIPPGTYSDSTTLNCANNATIWANGASVTYTGSTNAILCQNTVRSGIRGLTLTGPSATGSTQGLVVGSSNGLGQTLSGRFEGIYISGFGKAFVIDGGNNSGTYYNVFENDAAGGIGTSNSNGIGWYIVPTVAAHANDNTFIADTAQNSRTHGWQIDGSLSNTFVNDEAESNNASATTGYGFYLPGTQITQYNIWSGGYTENNTYGFYCGNLSNVRENQINGTTIIENPPAINTSGACTGALTIMQSSSLGSIDYFGGPFQFHVDPGTGAQYAWGVVNDEVPTSTLADIIGVTRSSANNGFLEFGTPEYPATLRSNLNASGNALNNIVGITNNGITHVNGGLEQDNTDTNIPVYFPGGSTGGLTYGMNLICWTSGAQCAATSLANFNSPFYGWESTYWNGSASAIDFWSAYANLGSGTNPTSTLTFLHGGSSGTSLVQVPSMAILSAAAPSGLLYCLQEDDNGVVSNTGATCGGGGGGGVTYTSPTVNAIPMVVDATAPGTLGNSGSSSAGTGGLQGYSGTVGNPNPEWQISPYAYPGGFDFSTNTFGVPGGENSSWTFTAAPSAAAMAGCGSSCYWSPLFVGIDASSGEVDTGNHAYGLALQETAGGTGNFHYINPLWVDVAWGSSGTADQFEAGQLLCEALGAGTLNECDGLEIILNTGGGNPSMVTGKGLLIDSPGSATAVSMQNDYGIDIQEQDGCNYSSGPACNFNILSEGATTYNQFDGTIFQGDRYMSQLIDEDEFIQPNYMEGSLYPVNYLLGQRDTTSANYWQVQNFMIGYVANGNFDSNHAFVVGAEGTLPDDGEGIDEDWYIGDAIGTSHEIEGCGAGNVGVGGTGMTGGCDPDNADLYIEAGVAAIEKVAFQAPNFQLTSAVAVSALPSCASATLGSRILVNDATLATPGSTAAGGGNYSIAVECIYDSGTTVYTWIVD